MFLSTVWTKLCTKLLVTTTTNLSILLYQNNIVMKQYDKLKNILIYLATLFLNCKPCFISCQTLECQVWDQIVSVQMCTSVFYTLANDAANVIAIFP